LFAQLTKQTDATFSKLLESLKTGKSELPLAHIQQLKLRQTSLTDASIIPLLKSCPNLLRLDLGFTGVRHAYIASSLEKLVLTSTAISTAELAEALKPLKKLRVLHLAAMGGGHGTSARIGNTSAMTLSDASLRGITDVLAYADNLEVVNLVGNTKLGLARHEGALADFITRIGRRCKVSQLNPHMMQGRS
jgi:hypothetical protein